MKDSKKSIDYNIIKKKISEIIRPRDKALCAVLYGTAGRINEVLEVKREDVKEEDNFLLVSLVTEKNWQHPTRIVPIKKDLEFWIVEPILNWLEICGEQLFPFSDRWARKIVHRWMGCHPHLLRHSRLTHLVSIFKADAHRLQLIAGWRSPEPAGVYIHLNWQDTKNIFEY